MNIRRITLALGAAAGGLLAAAFLPLAVANADSGGAAVDAASDAMLRATPDVFGFSPDSSETVLTVSGLPPLYQQVEGYNTFDYYTTGDTSPVGSFNADVSTLTTPGFENTEYLVTGDQTYYGIEPSVTDAGNLPTDAGNLPTTGSVYDIANFGDGFSNDYSDVAPQQAYQLGADSLMGTGTTATGTITDTFVTPFGSFDLTPLVDSFSTLVHGDFLTTIDPSSLADGFTDLSSIVGFF
jgi:hypothetical protein